MALDKLRRYAPWIIVGADLAFLVLSLTQQSQTEMQRVKARFVADTTEAERVVHERVDGDVALLHTLADFIGTHRVDSSLWRRGLDSIPFAQRSPSMDGIGYAAYIPDNLRSPQMKILPRGKRFDYVVVQQMEPQQAHARLMGYDLGSDLAARTAAEHARDTQSAALTGKLMLPDDPEHAAILIFYPIFRQEELQGWIFERFRQEDFLKGLPLAGSSLILQAYDGPAMSREGLFFDTGGALAAWQKPNDDPMTVVKGFQAPGRLWTLNFSPRPGVVLPPQPEKGGGIPVVIVIELLLLMGALGWGWARHRAEVLARQMLTPMRMRENALTLGPHGIVIADASEPDLPIVYVNRAFEKMTGYTAQEVLGKNCRFLAGTDRDQKGLQDLRRALREQRDCRVLLRNYRKDGTPFWNDLFVSPVRNDMGRVVEYVAIQQEVTEREQTARRLATEGAIIRALAESPSLYEAAPRILRAICEAQEWDLGTFWRLDGRAHTLQCVDQWHPADLEIEDLKNFIRGATLHREMGVPGHVWTKGEQVWMPDLTKETRFPDASLAVQAGLVSACGFPIAGRRGLQGVLVFYSRRIWPLSKNLLLLMVGTGAQISQYMERELIEIEQKEITLLERGLAEFMGEGLLAMDRDGFCIYLNTTAGRMLGYNPRTLLGQNVHDFLHPPTSSISCQPNECPLLLSLHSTKATHVDSREALFMRKDKDPLPVAYTTSPIVAQDLIQGVVVTFVDASARRAQENELRQALEEKENEIKRIQQMLSQTREVKIDPNSSDLLIDKIRKLLG